MISAINCTLRTVVHICVCVYVCVCVFFFLESRIEGQIFLKNHEMLCTVFTSFFFLSSRIKLE